MAAGNVLSPTYSESWTFSGTIGERILIGAVATSGTLNTSIALYPPGEATPVLNTGGGDRADYQLGATGTYTIQITDVGLNDEGTYNLSFLKVTAGPYTCGGDPDGGAIASAEVRSGTLGAVADFDGYTFTGTVGDRVLVGAVATGGGSHNTVISLYPPGGGAGVVGNGNDRLDYQLTLSGTYTIVIEEFALNDVGTYSVSFMNVTAGPHSHGGEPDWGTIASNGGTKSGQVAPVPDMDAYTFTGTVGDNAQIVAITTGGSLNTTIYVYPPSGGAAVVATSADNVNLILGASGLYTIVIEDAGLNDIGTYNLTLTKSGSVTAAEGAQGPLDPLRVLMLPAYPCPFSVSATLAFSLPGERAVQLRVFDVSGALVWTITDGTLRAGVHRFTWDGRDAYGKRAAAGVYHSELRAGHEVLRGKLVHVR